MAGVSVQRAAADVVVEVDVRVPDLDRRVREQLARLHARHGCLGPERERRVDLHRRLTGVHARALAREDLAVRVRRAAEHVPRRAALVGVGHDRERDVDVPERRPIELTRRRVHVRPTPQSTQPSPPAPHAFAAVPGWHPVAEQHPFVQVAWHEPSMQVWFEQTPAFENCACTGRTPRPSSALVVRGAHDARVAVAAALARVRAARLLARAGGALRGRGADLAGTSRRRRTPSTRCPSGTCRRGSSPGSSPACT